MGRRVKKKDAAPSGVIASLDNVEHLQSEIKRLTGKEAPAFWVPNACYLCKGTKEQLDEEGDTIACPYCEGTGYGPQYKMVTTMAEETLVGGAKGGGKSMSMTVWMVSGNPHLPDYTDGGTPILVNQSYTYHPKFRGLVLRKNAIDLKSWVEATKPMYAKYGGEWVGDEFRFTGSGAVIWTGHLDNDEAYEKYQGIPELHRVAIEEVCQIPNLERYMQIQSCVRSTTPELREQTFNTANPIGKGVSWVRDRFVRVKDADGNLIPHGKMIKVEVELKDGRKHTATRLFIPAGWRDNPHLSVSYLARLHSLPEKLRLAYEEGDWEAMTGAYFDFRPEGALAGEPENANHVIGPRNTEARKRKHNQHDGSSSVPDWKEYPKIKRWWPRAIGGDWGFAHKTAFYWGAGDPDTGQIHAYREMVLTGTGTETIGVELARACYQDLVAAPDGGITLWMSPDAFAVKSDDMSFVSLIANGVAKVLGPEAIHVPEIEIANREAMRMPGMDQQLLDEFKEWKEKLLAQRNAGITIRKANRNRVLGWNYVRDLLNWKPPIEPNEEAFDADFYRKLALDVSLDKAAEYYNTFTRQRRIYPHLVIWEEACPHLIAAFPNAMHDEKNPEDVEKDHFDGADELEALRYLAMGLQEPVSSPAFLDLKERYIEEYDVMNPNATTSDRVHMHDWLNAREQDAAQNKRIVIPRAATAKRRRSRAEFKKILAGRT